MLQISFTPFPILSTERLVLRQMNKDDENEFFTFRSDKEIMKFIPRPLAKSKEDARNLILHINDLIDKNEAITWAITLKESSELIGTIGYVRMSKENYRAEIGYLLGALHQGKGIMQEALKAVIDYGFAKMNLHSIEAVVSPENIASIQLLERNSFIREAYFKENQFYSNAFHDTAHYSLLAKL